MPATPSRAEFTSRLRRRPLRRDDVVEAMPLAPWCLGLIDPQRARHRARGICERIETADLGRFGDLADTDDGERGPETRRQVPALRRPRSEEPSPWTLA